MTEQEQRFSEYDRQITIAAVIATNAIITDEQYQKLARVIGNEVEIQVKERHVIDEMSGRPSLLHWTFVLCDFNFVENPRDRRVLAFLRGREGNTIFPYTTREDNNSYRWTTHHDTSVEKVVDLGRGETIWSYDHYGEPILVNGGIFDFKKVDIINAIETFSTSYVDSTRQRK